MLPAGRRRTQEGMTTNPARQPEGVPTGGQFAPMTKSEAKGVTLAASSPNIEAMADALDALRLDWAKIPSSGIEHRDRTTQHAAVQLAAASIRRDHPGARTLVLRENQYGEGRYEPLSVLDKNGNPIRDAETDATWIYEEVAGEGSVSMHELTGTLNLEDDSWADGIAELRESSFNGSMALIDIDAAIAKPAPPAPGSKAGLLERYAATGERVAASRLQYRAAQDLDQHASVQLAAASILERYPEADTLHLSENADEGDGSMQVEAISGNGTEIAHYADGDDFHLKPGTDGTPDLEHLLGDLNTDSMAWCEGISTAERDDWSGYRVAIDLKAALAKPAPAVEG